MLDILIDAAEAAAKHRDAVLDLSAIDTVPEGQEMDPAAIEQELAGTIGALTTVAQAIIREAESLERHRERIIREYPDAFQTLA